MLQRCAKSIPESHILTFGPDDRPVPCPGPRSQHQTTQMFSSVETYLLRTGAAFRAANYIRTAKVIIHDDQEFLDLLPKTRPCSIKTCEYEVIYTCPSLMIL